MGSRGPDKDRRSGVRHARGELADQPPPFDGAAGLTVKRVQALHGADDQVPPGVLAGRTFRHTNREVLVEDHSLPVRLRTLQEAAQ